MVKGVLEVIVGAGQLGLCAYVWYFQNPGKRPIQEVFVLINEDGIVRKIPALDERWVKLSQFGRYKQMPVKENDELANKSSLAADLEEWKMDMGVFCQQLELMVNAEYYEFWSTAIHCKDFSDALVSFLQNSNPCYVSAKQLYGSDGSLREVYYKILRAVLIILHRLTKNKESETEFMTDDDLAETLYKNYLITIPMLFDILITFGTGTENLPTLQQLFSRIFKLQPKYKYDLLISLKYIRGDCLQSVEREIENSSKSLGQLNDLILFCLDSISILRMIIEVCPSVAVELFLKIEMEQELTQFYDNVVPVFYKNAVVFEGHDETIENLKKIRVEALKSFRGIVNYHLDEILKRKSDNIDLVEKVLAMYNLALTDHAFVLDYQNQFKVETDLELMRQACLKMDSFKADFILQAYLSDEKTLGANYKGTPKDRKSKQQSAFTASESEPGASSSASIQPQSRDFDLEASQVQDLFPHLGDGFIRKLLPRYESSELAISAIIESNLPPDMLEVDQTEPYIPEDPRDAVFKETGIHRINVFSGDALDVMTNDELKCTVKYKGVTVGAHKTVEELLDDKTHIRENRLRYEQYTMVPEGDYDDEYDDSYDAMAESESKARKSKSAKEVVFDESSSSSEEEEDGEENARPNNAFCENPEVIRARREQQYQQKFRARGGGGGGGGGARRDVVGTGTKGQGQSDSVLFNRHKKDQNKSSRGNHNRRQGANFKRSRGMIPS